MAGTRFPWLLHLCAACTTSVWGLATEAFDANALHQVSFMPHKADKELKQLRADWLGAISTNGRRYRPEHASKASRKATAKTIKAAKRGIFPDGDRDLAFVHVPTNFGHTIEVAGLRLQTRQMMVRAFFSIVPTFRAIEGKPKATQRAMIEKIKLPGGALWGMMEPDLLDISSETGCDLYYTPQKYWSPVVADQYFRNKTVFGMLRDPYDRMVNEFRMNVLSISSAYRFVGGQPQSRYMVSKREGHLEKEAAPYTAWYKDCDVNAWVKAELKKYKKGDRFRGNCHLLPQAEFFDGPYGITLPVDVRKMPNSINEVMKGHGYPVTVTDYGHNVMCQNVDAWSLDNESKMLIQEVYARDFDLVCKHFGYCDRDEMTCLSQVPMLCGQDHGAKL